MDDWPTNTSYGLRRNVIAIADGDDALRTGAEAAAFADLRLIARYGWAAAADELRGHAAIDVLMIDASGMAPDTMTCALPEVEAFAQRHAAQVVAILDEDQIDLVSAHLFGRHVQLLCAPTTAERVAALTLAVNMPADLLFNEARDAEAQRLRRLNEEVARIAETLARLTRGDALAPEPPGYGVADRKLGYGAPPGGDDSPVTPAELRQAIRTRRLRAQFFDDGLFEDPAWDMLLDLFAAELERAQVSVSSLCIAAAVAPTTALRWIAKMTDLGLFERHPDPFDRRRAFMALSARARQGMRDYCAAARRSGLSIA